MKQFFWGFAECGWVAASKSFDKTYFFHLQGCETVSLLITPRVKAANFFESSVTNYPTARRNQPQNLLPQQPRGTNLKSLFSYSYEYIPF